MATPRIRVVHFLTPTSNGDIDVTHPDIGTVNAAIIIAADADALNTTKTHARRSKGFIAFDSGIEQGVMSWHCRDAVSTSDASRYGSGSQCLALLNNTGLNVEASCTAQIAGGFRLNFTNTGGNPKLCTAILFEGVGAQVFTDTMPHLTTKTFNTRKRPDMIFGESVGLGSLGTIGSSATPVTGIAVRDVGQHSDTLYIQDNLGTTNNAQSMSNNLFMRTHSVGSWSWEVIVQNWAANSFQLNNNSAAGTSSDYITMLVLSLDDDAEYAITGGIWNSSGNIVNTLPFQPAFSMHHVNYLSTAWNTRYTNSNYVQNGILINHEHLSDFRWYANNSRGATGTSVADTRVSTDGMLSSGGSLVMLVQSFVYEPNGWTITSTLSANSLYRVVAFGQETVGGADGVFLGPTPVDAIKLGSADVAAAYLGSTQIF